MWKLNMQKQPLKDIPGSVLKNFANIHRKTPVFEFLH